MKNRLLHITMIVMALVMSHPVASAQVYFYDTWHQIFDMTPVKSTFRSSVRMISGYEFYFGEEGSAIDTEAGKHIAAELCDTIWLINSKYLKRAFKGDGSMLRGYVPLFFNERFAYAIYKPWDNPNCDVEYYYIDFQNRRVDRAIEDVMRPLILDLTE